MARDRISFSIQYRIRIMVRIRIRVRISGRVRVRMMIRRKTTTPSTKMAKFPRPLTQSCKNRDSFDRIYFLSVDNSVSERNHVHKRGTNKRAMHLKTKSGPSFTCSNCSLYFLSLYLSCFIIIYLHDGLRTEIMPVVLTIFSPAHREYRSCSMKFVLKGKEGRKERRKEKKDSSSY